MTAGGDPVWFWPLLLTVVAIGYGTTALRLRRHGRWPARRPLLFYGGLTLVAISVTGPLADQGHRDFPAHMSGHLLLAMLAPILLALSAPMTLILRALPVSGARRLVSLLKSRPVRALTHPATTAVLNIGGLWLLYTTRLYGLMHEHAWLGVAVHLHLLLAGYLFTASIIGIDPAPHRPSWLVRAVVLVLALGAHAVLAKFLYAHPPSGVSIREAETGSQLMYYGGDLVDLLLIVVFCQQWFQAARPRPTGPVRHSGPFSAGQSARTFLADADRP